jgi:diguanylate cyclase (GGDEF)-like protein
LYRLGRSNPKQVDAVIKDIAKILVQCTRQTDFVARYGGEEFCVILPDTPLEGAVKTAEKIRLAYKAHDIKNIADGSIIKSTCTLGVASLKGNNFATIQEFIEAADQLLYVGKKGGRDRVVFKQPGAEPQSYSPSPTA